VHKVKIKSWTILCTPRLIASWNEYYYIYLTQNHPDQTVRYVQEFQLGLKLILPQKCNIRKMFQGRIRTIMVRAIPMQIGHVIYLTCETHTKQNGESIHYIQIQPYVLLHGSRKEACCLPVWNVEAFVKWTVNTEYLLRLLFKFEDSGGVKQSCFLSCLSIGHRIMDSWHEYYSYIAPVE